MTHVACAVPSTVSVQTGTEEEGCEARQSRCEGRTQDCDQRMVVGVG